MEEIIRLVARVFSQYAVIGGIPASIWGKPRTTLDVDVVVLLAATDIDLLLDTLKLNGFTFTKTAKQRLQKGLAVKFSHGRGLSLDIRLATYAVDQQAVRNSVTKMVFGVPLRLASREDTIIYKIARFNDQDKADIRNIVIRQWKRLDIPYLNRYAQTLADETGRQYILSNLAIVLSWIHGKD